MMMCFNCIVIKVIVLYEGESCLMYKDSRLKTQWGDLAMREREKKSCLFEGKVVDKGFFHFISLDETNFIGGGAFCISS